MTHASRIYNALGQPMQVSIPNGMTTVYTYDTRNRLTKIEHKDGSTVLDGWTYALDDQGNITRTDQADGSYWTYGYDGRYRLTTADRYEASGSSIRAQYAYAYDAADNLTAKTEPFLDDFEDGNATGWTLGTGWSASTKVMKETNSASTRFHRALSKHDVDIRFRYMTTDTTAGLFGEMCFRTISNNVTQNNVVVRMATDGMKLQKVYLGNTTVLANNTSATSSANTWYRVRILAKGANVTVWRGEGDDGPMERVLSTTSAPTMTPASMWFISGANAAFAYDDIEIVADGWTSDTTFAVNSGNELTSSTFGGVTTTYGYDAWGQMTGKARGSYSASYAWHYGGKLTGVTSTFPGEGTVTYAYGGEGKRRERDDGTTVTWYNYDTGWNLLNEEDGTGALTRTFVHAPQGAVGPVLADVAGGSPASGAYRYYTLDHLGSTNGLYDGTKAKVAALAYTPYGAAYGDVGPAPLPRYTGHLWDGAAGLYLAPYRAYAPTLAGWLSRDPLGMVDGPNVYEYVRGNPVGAVDPEGALIVAPIVLGAIGGCIVGAVTAIAAHGASVTGEQVRRGAMCGCLGGGIGGMFGGLIGSAVSGAAGAFTQCMCNRGWTWSGCCASAALGGAIGGVLGHGSFSSRADSLGLSEGASEAAGAFGSGVGSTLGGAVGEALCCD